MLDDATSGSQVTTGKRRSSFNNPNNTAAPGSEASKTNPGTESSKVTTNPGNNEARTAPPKNPQPEKSRTDGFTPRSKEAEPPAYSSKPPAQKVLKPEDIENEKQKILGNNKDITTSNIKDILRDEINELIGKHNNDTMTDQERKYSNKVLVPVWKDYKNGKLTKDKMLERVNAEIKKLEEQLKGLQDNDPEKEQIKFNLEKLTALRDKDIKAHTNINEFIDSKAKYNLTGDPGYLKKNLPYRESLRKDPKKLKEFDDLVKQIMGKVKIVGGEVKIEFDEKGNSTVKPKDKRDSLQSGKNSVEIDPATKYIVAAHIAEMLQKRPDLIQDLMNKKPPPTIGFVQPFTEDKDGNKQYIPTSIRGTYSEDGSNFILINNAQFWDRLIKGNADGTNTLLHELGHLLDDEEGEGADGEFAKMTDEQKKILNKEIKRLFEAFHKYREGKSETELEAIKRQIYDPATGLTNYAFESHAEFLAEVFAMLKKDPERLKGASLIAYEVLRQFFEPNPSKEVIAHNK